MIYNIDIKVVKSGAKCSEITLKMPEITLPSYYNTWAREEKHPKNDERRRKMLSGEYKHGIDTKNRLFIPARHREELGECFIIAKSIREKCLRVYSLEEWQAYIRPIEALDGKDKERIVRALSRNAAQVSPDSQGRVVLTPDLIKYAEIDKNTYIVGCGHYSEIWSDTNYEAMVEEEDLASMRDLLESYGL